MELALSKSEKGHADKFKKVHRVKSKISQILLKLKLYQLRT